MRTRGLILLSLLFSATITQAANYYGPGHYQRGPGHYGMSQRTMPSQRPMKSAVKQAEPGELLKAGMEKLLSFFKGNQRPSKAELRAFLEKEVVPYFDFIYMAKMAGGPMYTRMSESKKQQLVNRLSGVFIKSMVERLATYAGQGVKYMPARMSGDGKSGSASVMLVNPRGYPAKLDFKFYKSGNGWKVYDVSANGQSAILYFRQQLRYMTQRRMS